MKMLPPRATAVFLLSALVALFSGCATTPKLSGVEEYKQLTKRATVAVQKAVHSLEKVSASPGPPAPKTIAEFERNLQSLQVDSVQIRARARAIRARGDAYFADWSENIAKIENPKVRAAAERSRPQLQASFEHIKLASQQAGAAFDPFLSGLLKLRVELELRPEAMASPPGNDLARTTLGNGHEVLADLAKIESELQTITKLLTP